MQLFRPVDLHSRNQIEGIDGHFLSLSKHYSCLSIRLSVSLSFCPSVCVSFCLSVCLSVCLSACLCVCVSACCLIEASPCQEEQGKSVPWSPLLRFQSGPHAYGSELRVQVNSQGSMCFSAADLARR
jgi:hypothetical protein